MRALTVGVARTARGRATFDSFAASLEEHKKRQEAGSGARRDGRKILAAPASVAAGGSSSLKGGTGGTGGDAFRSCGGGGGGGGSAAAAAVKDADLKQLLVEEVLKWSALLDSKGAGEEDAAVDAPAEPPMSFADVGAYQEFMRPLLLMELREELVRGREEARSGAHAASPRREDEPRRMHFDGARGFTCWVDTGEHKYIGIDKRVGILAP